MKASLLVAALIVSVLVVTNSATADIAGAIDFNDLWNDSSDNGSEIPVAYAHSSDVTTEFRVTNGADVFRNRMQVWDATEFSFSTGGVGMDSTDALDNTTYWGEISLTVNDALSHDIALGSFLLGRRASWVLDDDALDKKLAVEIYYDGMIGEQLVYWQLTNDGALASIEVTPSSTVFAKSVAIRWNCPYNIGMGDVDYMVRPVPEPAALVTWVLGLTGLGLLGCRRWRRNRV